MSLRQIDLTGGAVGELEVVARHRHVGDSRDTAGGGDVHRHEVHVRRSVLVQVDVRVRLRHVDPAPLHLHQRPARPADDVVEAEPLHRELDPALAPNLEDHGVGDAREVDGLEVRVHHRRQSGEPAGDPGARAQRAHRQRPLRGGELAQLRLRLGVVQQHLGVAEECTALVFRLPPSIATSSTLHLIGW